jgi:hypothetical protein
VVVVLRILIVVVFLEHVNDHVHLGLELLQSELHGVVLNAAYDGEPTDVFLFNLLHYPVLETTVIG